jgi:hypothetical protein
MSIASWFAPSIQTVSARCVGRTKPAPRRAATRANSASLALSMKTVWKNLAFAHRSPFGRQATGAALGRDKARVLAEHAVGHHARSSGRVRYGYMHLGRKRQRAPRGTTL